MTRRHAEAAQVPVVDLRQFLPALRAGVRALRERQRWARSAFLSIDAQHAAEEASVLEALASQIEREGAS